MKSKEEIKAELHRKIDSIEDEHLLHVLNEDIIMYAIDNLKMDQGEDDDCLTPEQEGRLHEAIKQAEVGKVITLDEFYSRMKEWRTK